MGIYKDLEGNILDWNKEAINKALSNNSKLNGGVYADVSNVGEIETAFKKVDEIIGGIDILISNAGISFRKPFLEIGYEEWSIQITMRQKQE